MFHSFYIPPEQETANGILIVIIYPSHTNISLVIQSAYIIYSIALHTHENVVTTRIASPKHCLELCTIILVLISRKHINWCNHNKNTLKGAIKAWHTLDIMPQVMSTIIKKHKLKSNQMNSEQCIN